ncbi:AcrR family transcriptional regulator [Rhizobium sp. SG_E_25_P2]|jgi:AcrR family transcriptional regulator|uniref:TetR/AcrR family transcriptional regulator n=1 Tax=Rhizobium sp. SG_E_25_P2 TaxID=2879942 RepID=UPI002474DE8A|nr:TetR/AcrR family transcriptional regulator [Rhizobium sp. SG_E_25_P2]MDH6266035.1 AcrR family transcriptional regulator [Rhizobium sp. SG_E_25_P2]
MVDASAKKPGGRSAVQTRANGDHTREKILNAAELLFGNESFDTVSLRDITNAAGVTLALASYHFKVKENLFSAVVARRAAVLNETRRERLAALEAEGRMTVEALLDAFMHPLFEQMQSDDEGWQAYVLLLAKLGANDRWLHYIHENFDETANLFIDRLRALLPGLTEENLLRGFSFVLVLMLQTVSKSRRLDSLSDGRFSSADLDTSYQVLLNFCMAGLDALRR